METVRQLTRVVIATLTSPSCEIIPEATIRWARSGRNANRNSPCAEQNCPALTCPVPTHFIFITAPMACKASAVNKESCIWNYNLPTRKNGQKLQHTIRIPIGRWKMCHPPWASWDRKMVLCLGKKQLCSVFLPQNKRQGPHTIIMMNTNRTATKLRRPAWEVSYNESDWSGTIISWNFIAVHTVRPMLSAFVRQWIEKLLRDAAYSSGVHVMPLPVGMAVSIVNECN